MTDSSIISKIGNLVSVLPDDRAGFDILSRNDIGSDRYIEVKTTQFALTFFP